MRRLILGGLLVIVVAFAVFALEHMLPPQPYGLADDWRVFYAASLVVQHGGTPYDAGSIHAAEQAAQHYATVQPSLDDFTDLPLVPVLLRAVTWLPYWWSFAAVTALGLVLAAVSVCTWLRECGWTRLGPWLLGAMCSWPMLLGFFSGQFDALLLGGTVLSLILARRERAAAAGLCMAVVVLKPHLLWPLPLLLFAGWVPDWRQAWRFAAAAAAVLAGGAALGFALVPGSTGFFGHLLGFGARVGTVQPDLAGLPGLLLHLPGGGIAAAGVAGLGVAGVVALALASARSPRLRELGTQRRTLLPLLGTALWLACAPYAHPNDDVLLFPLLALLAGPNAAALRGRALAAGAAGSLALIAVFLATPAAGFALLAAAACLLVAGWRRLTPESVTAVAVVALAVLPMAWPFHVLAAPVTPVAIAIVAIAGALQLRGLLSAAGASVGQGQRRGRIGRVVVEPAAALAPQPAVRHQPLQDP